MASTVVLLLQLLLVSLASASHYMGGTLTFTHKGRNPDGTFTVDIRERDTYDGCQYSLSWQCLTGSCGSDTTIQRGILDQSTSAPQSNRRWCETETVSRRNVPSDKPFQLRVRSCCWIRRRDSGSWWRSLTLLDLGTRSDTGKPNSSPDIAILPFLRVPQNCPRTYNLTSFDPDGDKVRCRYGSVGSGECDSCNQHSGFHLHQDSCTLHYQHATANPRVFGFEMMVEDFPQSSITLNYTDGSKSVRAPLTPANTSPLSKLPLQFSFLVDPPAPSCVVGHCLPKLLYPTPENGARIQAEVNKEMEIKIKAQATHALIYDVIMSGPLNISKHRIAYDEFAIRWTPIPDDLGDQYAICFAVESATGSAVTVGQFAQHQHQHQHQHPTPSSQSGIYQSEMRCVLVDIVEKQVQSNVICTESTMTVEVQRSSLLGLREGHLRLSDPSDTACSLQRHSNSTHIVAVIPLNSCGTQIEEDDDNLFFKNEITTDDADSLITRKHLLEFEFYCQYPKRGNVSAGFTAHRNNVTVWEKGFGTFTYQFEFYPNSKFQTMIDPNSYPLVYEVGSKIYMEIEATSSVNNTELFVESCRATPYDNPNYWPAYSIIENGCNVDSTVVVHSPSHERQFKFSMEAFKFIGLHDQVYISCTVLMCEAGAPNTRCSQGCTNSSWPHNQHHQHKHQKREAVTQSSKHFVSQGPLRLRRSAESTESPVMYLNLNVAFIAGCLLAAVGMISAVVMFKAKMSKVKYQPLTTLES